MFLSGTGPAVVVSFLSFLLLFTDPAHVARIFQFSILVDVHSVVAFFSSFPAQLMASERTAQPFPKTGGFSVQAFRRGRR